MPYSPGIPVFQSDFVDWILIEDPNSKSDFGFLLSIQFFIPNLRKTRNVILQFLTINFFFCNQAWPGS